MQYCRLPLELHAIHFKTNYATQAEAVKYHDGIIIVVYLFVIQSNHSATMYQILSQLKNVRIAESAATILPFQITELLYPIKMDYYMYYGSIIADKMDPSILWIISRETGSISVEQLKLFHLLLDNRMRPIYQNFSNSSPHFNRTVFHVNPRYKITNTTLSPVPRVEDGEELCKEKYDLKFSV